MDWETQTLLRRQPAWRRWFLVCYGTWWWARVKLSQVFGKAFVPRRRWRRVLGKALVFGSEITLPDRTGRLSRKRIPIVEVSAVFGAAGLLALKLAGDAVVIEAIPHIRTGIAIGGVVQSVWVIAGLVYYGLTLHDDD